MVDIFPDLSLFEVNVFFDGFLDQKFEVALLSPLDRNKQLVEFVVNEPVQVLDDVLLV